MGNMQQQATRTKVLSRKVLYWLVGIVACTVLVHLTLQYINLNIYDQKNGFVYELSNRFDLDDEVSGPTWLSSMFFLAISLSCFALACLEQKRKKFWTLLAGLSLFMSFDEVSTIHELTLQSIHNIFFLDSAPAVLKNAWILALPVLCIVGIFLAWYAWRNVPKRTHVLFVVGGVILLSGAVLVDIAAATVSTTPFMQQGVLVAIEEGAEFTGAAIILYALINHILLRHEKSLRGIKQVLKQNN